MSKHTPGPWSVDAIETTLVRGPDRYPIADPERHFREITECEANARLIAAAPDLLAALKMMISDWDGEPEDIAEAQDAIRNAEGGD